MEVSLRWQSNDDSISVLVSVVLKIHMHHYICINHLLKRAIQEIK